MRAAWHALTMDAKVAANLRPPFRIPPRRNGIIVRGGMTAGNGLAVQVGTLFAAIVWACRPNQDWVRCRTYAHAANPL